MECNSSATTLPAGTDQGQMPGIRILHVDDEPDIREIVGMSLSLNEGFQVRSCATGAEAVAAAAEWSPYLILLDVMMPGMDGLATLAQLRQHRATAEIPVMFMTARGRPNEIDYFVSQGAQGVITKPFDPMTLAFRVRNHLMAIREATLGYAFATRAKLDANLLEPLRAPGGKEISKTNLARIGVIAHGLASTAEVFGLDEIRRTASMLEDAVIAQLEGVGTQGEVSRSLDCLLVDLESQWTATPRRRP